MAISKENVDKKAIKQSIVKWERNLNKFKDSTGVCFPPVISITVHDCPLCGLYYDIDCDGCPVRNKTKRSFCRKTPYERYEKWDEKYCSTNMDVISEKEIERGKKAIGDEIVFLKSLLVGSK